MRTMREYLNEANNLLSSIGARGGVAEIRSYFKKFLPEWSTDEQEDLLALCADMARAEAEAVANAANAAFREGHAHSDEMRKVSDRLRKFKTREKDQRKTKARRAVIERHFGAALRGEGPVSEVEA